MLARVQVEHEVHQRAFELGSEIPIHRKPRACQLRSALQIENAQFLAQLPMRLGREIKMWRSSPASHFDVVGFAAADGHAVVGKVGNADENVAQPRVGFFRDFLGFGDFLAQIFGLVD